jgi:hypothetical protein
MLKNKLANELRERQCNYGACSRKEINSITDDEIIDCYITCSCCGEKQVDDEKQLTLIIEKANSADEFFAACDLVAKTKMMVN